MGNIEYGYELTVNIVAEMVLDYLIKNSNMDKDLDKKSYMEDYGGNEKNMQDNKYNKRMIA